MGLKRLLVLARARITAQRVRLYAGRLDHMEQGPGHGRPVEVIEEHRQVRLAVDEGKGPGSQCRDASPRAVDVECEGAELPEPELDQHAQPVYRRVERLVLEDVDGRGQVDAAAVGGIFVAYPEMAVAARDSLRKQREGAFDIGEVDHS